MGIEKMRALSTVSSVYWINKNTDIETTLKHFATCMEYKKKTHLHHKIMREDYTIQNTTQGLVGG